MPKSLLWTLLHGILLALAYLIHVFAGRAPARSLPFAYGFGILIFLGAVSFSAISFIRPQGGGSELLFVFSALFISWCGGAVLYRFTKKKK